MMDKRSGILKILRYIFLSFIIVLGLISIVGTNAPDPLGNDGDSSKTSGTGGDTKWTYMVYIAGDNNLSDAAIGDINEMEQVGSNDSMNVVVQVEFSQQYTPDMSRNTLRGKILKDYDQTTISSPLEDMGDNLDMGVKETLTDFIKWAATNYPADYYVLVLWDHGAGWKLSRQTGGAVRGALQDETSGSFMSLPELASAVSESGVHLDVINFDACLMAMYEVAYEFNGLTDYMVFSEEVEPGDGDPYDTILQDLVDNPNMTPSELAIMITKEFKEFYKSYDRTKITKSAVDMSKTTQLHNQICTLAQFMNSNMDSERPHIQGARDTSINYLYPENHDLGDFLKYYYDLTSDSEIKYKITEIQTTLSEMVISNEIYSPENDAITGSKGLAVFLPRRDEVPDADLTRYSLLAINQSRVVGDNTWGSFVNLLVTGDTGQTPPLTAEGNFVIMLKWDTDADLDLLINEPDGTWAAPFIGATSPNGFLSEDSIDSGESTENYAAAETVEKGYYDVFVSYYKDGPSGKTPTTAYIYILDPANGVNEFPAQPDYQREMDLTNQAPIIWDDTVLNDIQNNIYSDWWWPTYLERSLNGEVSLDDSNININFIVIPSKKKLKRLPQID